MIWLREAIRSDHEQKIGLPPPLDPTDDVTASRSHPRPRTAASESAQSALKKLVNGPFTAHTPAGSWLGDEDHRACEDRVGGLVAHQHTQAGEFL